MTQPYRTYSREPQKPAKKNKTARFIRNAAIITAFVGVSAYGLSSIGLKERKIKRHTASIEKFVDNIVNNPDKESGFITYLCAYGDCMLRLEGYDTDAFPTYDSAGKAHYPKLNYELSEREKDELKAEGLLNLALVQADEYRIMKKKFLRAYTKYSEYIEQHKDEYGELYYNQFKKRLSDMKDSIDIPDKKKKETIKKIAEISVKYIDSEINTNRLNGVFTPGTRDYRIR